MVSHRSHRHNSVALSTRGTRITVLTAVAAATAAMGTSPAGAEPGDRASTAGAKVDRLYEDAERATENFNQASERAESLRKRVERVQDRAARGQAEVNRLRDALAAVAGAQYRGVGLDPTLALLLSADPDAYLTQAAALDLDGARTASRLADLQRAERALRQYRTEGTARFAQLAQQRRELARHRQTVQGKLREARRVLNQLTPSERAERERAERGDSRSPHGAGISPADTRASASGRAGLAVNAVRGALGRPYAWGRAGPSAFDCSGLTQWAYRQAGVSIPRTSQGQANAGQRVPLAQARPGDLVIYRDDASHVAMYVGGGQVVHAPYPGAQVRHDPVNMMPVHTVTRP